MSHTPGKFFCKIFQGCGISYLCNQHLIETISREFCFTAKPIEEIILLLIIVCFIFFFQPLVQSNRTEYDLICQRLSTKIFRNNPRWTCSPHLNIKDDSDGRTLSAPPTYRVDSRLFLLVLEIPYFLRTVGP